MWEEPLKLLIIVGALIDPNINNIIVIESIKRVLAKRKILKKCLLQI